MNNKTKRWGMRRAVFVADRLIIYAVVVYVLVLATVFIFRPVPKLNVGIDTVDQIQQIFDWNEKAFGEAK